MYSLNNHTFLTWDFHKEYLHADLSTLNTMKIPTCKFFFNVKLHAGIVELSFKINKNWNEIMFLNDLKKETYSLRPNQCFATSNCINLIVCFQHISCRSWVKKLGSLYVLHLEMEIHHHLLPYKTSAWFIWSSIKYWLI